MEGLQRDIDYKEARYREDLSSVTSGMDSLYDYVSRGSVDFRI